MIKAVLELELEKCPICGKSVTSSVDRSDILDIDFKISCICGLSKSHKFKIYGMTFREVIDEISKAVESWNRRVTNETFKK